MNKAMISSILVIVLTLELPAQGPFQCWRDQDGTRHRAYPGPGSGTKGHKAVVGGFQSPTNVEELNTSMNEIPNTTSPDGLTIYFSTDREGGHGGADIWLATRQDRSSPFGQPTNLPGGVNTGNRDTQATITPDGLEIFFVRNTTGGWEDNDLYHAERKTPDDLFGGAAPITEINTNVADSYPCISSDGLTLYFTSNRDPVGGNPDTDDIWYATRPDRSSPFGPPKLLPGVNSEADEFAFCLRSDGLAGYLVLREGFRDGHICETVRSSTSEPFTTPVLVSALMDPTCEDLAPVVTADGNELFFFSDSRSGGLGESDIWRSIRSGDKVPFKRGEANADGKLNITDAIVVLMHLFSGGDLSCVKSADCNDDGSVNLTDPVCFLRYLFLKGEPPHQPFPNCGEDSTADSLPCEEFPACPE